MRDRERGLERRGRDRVLGLEGECAGPAGNERHRVVVEFTADALHVHPNPERRLVGGERHLEAVDLRPDVRLRQVALVVGANREVRHVNPLGRP